MRTSDKEIQKRLDATIEYLAENGETHIEDLANYLSVSPLTVRRNIKELQEQNIIELKNSSLSLNQSAQKKWMRLKNRDARVRIQQAAAAMVKTGRRLLYQYQLHRPWNSEVYLRYALYHHHQQCQCGQY